MLHAWLDAGYIVQVGDWGHAARMVGGWGHAVDDYRKNTQTRKKIDNAECVKDKINQVARLCTNH